MYIDPALRIINAAIDPSEKKKVADAPVIHSRWAAPEADDIGDKMALSLAFLGDAINELNSNQYKPLYFDSYIKAIDLCITSYLALNHELISAEWALKLGDLHSVLSSSYGLKDQISIKIDNIKDLRLKLNKRLPDGQKLELIQDEKDNMISVFNLIIEYCKAINLSDIELMRTDMLFTFGQYANLRSLSKTLNAAHQKIVDVTFKEAVSKLVAQPNSDPVEKDEDATTLKVKQYEKTSYQYMHVNKEGELLIMLPFTGGGIISTDNTCKARLAIDRFCENIKGVIARYAEDLEKDIARIQAHDNTPEGRLVLEKKDGRLVVLRQWEALFEANPHLLEPNALFRIVQNKLKFSNTISTAHLVQHPDGVRGFRCEHNKTNPLTGTILSDKKYDAMFTNHRVVSELLRKLESAVPKYEDCNYKVIYNLAIAKYKNKSSYTNAEDMGPKDGELERFKWLYECIQEAVREKIDPDFKLKEEETRDGESLLSDEGLNGFRQTAWYLEDTENCDFEGAFNSLLIPTEWEKLEEQIQDGAFYTNREASIFMVMSQVFITTLTKVYYEEYGVKIDFAEFIEQPQNLDKFFDIVVTNFIKGKSFVDPILKDIINPALERKGLNKINTEIAAEQFKNVFKTINGSPHYDEFLQLPNKPVEDANTSVHFYSFGGSISCSINEVGLHNSVPYRPFVYEGDSTDISIRNKIGDYGFELKIDEYINSKKTPQEIAQFLTLGIPSNAEDKEERVYNVLPRRIIQEIFNRKDFADIRKSLVQKLGQGAYAKLAKSWGMTNCMYITPELELKLYMLYATKCENEWLHDNDDTKTLAALSGKSPENRILHMLLKLGITVVDSEVLRNDDNSAYIIECEEDKVIALLKQFVGLSNELYIRTELAESCYKAVPADYDINNYNNQDKPNDNSKIIIALRILFPNLNIRPDIKPYNESYDPNTVLVKFCEHRGYAFKCHNPETLNSVYETVNIYHADACRISVSNDAMLFFIRKQLGANSEISVANAKEAFKKANIYHMRDINMLPDGTFSVSLDKISQKAFFKVVLDFAKEAKELAEKGILHEVISDIVYLHNFSCDEATSEVDFADKFAQYKAFLNNKIPLEVKSGMHYPRIRDFSTLKLYSQEDFKSLNESLLFVEKELAALNATINMAPGFFEGLVDFQNELGDLCKGVRAGEKDIKVLPDNKKLLSRCLQYAGYGGLTGVGISSVLCYSANLPFTPLASSSLSNMAYLLHPISAAIAISTAIIGAIIAYATMEKDADPKFTPLSQ